MLFSHTDPLYCICSFVSRVNPKDPSKHSTLATQVFKPNDFAAQMNFSFANAWGIIKSIVDYCLPLPEGKYLMVKDPNKVPIVFFLSLSFFLTPFLLATIGHDASLPNPG